MPTNTDTDQMSFKIAGSDRDRILILGDRKDELNYKQDFGQNHNTLTLSNERLGRVPKILFFLSEIINKMGELPSEYIVKYWDRVGSKIGMIMVIKSPDGLSEEIIIILDKDRAINLTPKEYSIIWNFYIQDIRTTYPDANPLIIRDCMTKKKRFISTLEKSVNVVPNIHKKRVFKEKNQFPNLWR